MKAKNVHPDCVLTLPGRGMYMVRDVALNLNPETVRLLLSAGRTDPGSWAEFDPDQDLDIYTPEGSISAETLQSVLGKEHDA